MSNVEIIDTFFFARNFVDDSILIVGWRLVHIFLIKSDDWKRAGVLPSDSSESQRPSCDSPILESHFPS